MQSEDTLNPLIPETETSSEDTHNNEITQTQNANGQEEGTTEPENKGVVATRKRIPRGSAPPALSLDEAATIITRFYEEAGGEASYDPLSSITGNSTASSVFTKKKAALVNYDLITDENRFVMITPLGLRVAAPHDPAERVEALKEAFLHNEIFAKAYDRYKGRFLPQDEFLTNTFATSFVPRELATEWVEKFKASAAIAGLLEERNGKLQVRESVRLPEQQKQDTPPPEVKLDSPAPPQIIPSQVMPVQQAQRSETPYEVLIKILSPDMEDDEQQAVWTLIRYLKKQEAAK